MSVYAPAADYIWRLIESYDLDPDALFREAGIDPALRRDTQARISRADANRLNQLVFERTGDEAMGVRNTRHLHPSHLGALGYAWLASLTLRSALNKLSRYMRLVVQDVEFFYEEEGAEVRLMSAWSGGWTPAPFQRYAHMANLLTLMRHLLDEDMVPIRAEFESEPPSDLEPFEAFFRCPIQFERPAAMLVVDRNALDRPLPRGHAELAQATDEIVQRYLAQMDRDDVVSQVRTALTQSMSEGNVSIETVADQLAVSSRTLRRRLDEAETTFRDVLADLRQEMALRLINDPSLTLTEISYLLGFSEPSSFSRAYRNWTGNSPTAARRDT